jgi:hypothetical protein
MIEIISSVVARIFTTPANTESAKSHWCIGLLAEAKAKSKKSNRANYALNEVYKAGLKLMKLILRLRYQTRIENLLYRFWESREDLELPPSMLNIG